jgi:glycosyltransferase involved in cell wall biosynthesis
MTNNLVSVILPVFNGGKYLSAAIRSILNQSYTDFELIIINDGSTDNSSDIINAYAEQDGRIRVVERENKGLVYSLNEAIALAKGEYIARMDADDLAMPLRFEKQVKYFLDNNVEIVGGHYLIIDKENKIVDTCIVPVDSNAIIACLSVCPPFAHGSVMFKKEFWQANNMHYGKRFQEAEDYSLWQDFFNKGGRLGNIDEFIFSYRLHEASFTFRKLNKMNAEVKVLRRIFVKQHRKELHSSLIELAALKSRSLFEDALLLESAYLLTKHCGDMLFFSLLKRSVKKNIGLTIMKIFSGKI